MVRVRSRVGNRGVGRFPGVRRGLRPPRASGVDGVWLQAVLYKLAPFPWDTSYSARYKERLKNLNALVARARRHGIRVYLYVNEPRAMPLPFFESRGHLKGAVEGDHAGSVVHMKYIQIWTA